MKSMRITRVLVAVALLALALGLSVPRAEAAACGKVTAPFTQNNAQIFQSNGELYVPLGVTISGLERTDYADFHDSDMAEIDAAAAWCANTVRLQVTEQHISDPGVLDALDAYVQHAEALGLVVVINDNDEWDSPDTRSSAMRRWSMVSGPILPPAERSAGQMHRSECRRA
jgi:hypothetical protein